jgi:hypothetical protein
MWNFYILVAVNYVFKSMEQILIIMCYDSESGPGAGDHVPGLCHDYVISTGVGPMTLLVFFFCIP